MPTWTSAPSLSTAAISSALAIPPATVTLLSPAARTTRPTPSISIPVICPSRSTKVTRNPPTSSLSQAILSITFRPVPSVQPLTTTSPFLASNAAIIRSRGSLERRSGSAAVPMITRLAPASSHMTAASRSLIPPPTRQGKRRTSSLIMPSLFPCPSAASRSMTASSPATEKRSATGIGSPASMASFFPPISCTALPPIMSIEGISMV